MNQVLKLRLVACAAVCLFLLVCAPWLAAQVPVTATHITDAFQRPLKAAKLCFAPVDAMKTAAGFRVGSVQVVPGAVCESVTAGVLKPGLSVAPSPAGIYYHIYVTSTFNTVLRDYGMTPITGASWTLDTYDPNLVVLPVTALSAGTFTTLAPGTGAACTLTGSNPTLLNCGVPQGAKGDTGVTGPAPSLTIGTVSTLAPGAAATATVTGSAGNYTINVGIPAGVPPNIAMGPVTTGAAGTSAQVSIAGTSPNYTLTLTIPQGVKGDTGAQGASTITGMSGDGAGNAALTGKFTAGIVAATAIALNLPGADSTGATDNSTIVNAVIAAQVASTLGTGQCLSLPAGKYYAPSLSNAYGVCLIGPGILTKSISQTVTGGAPFTTKAQANSYAYAAPRLMFGQEYLGHWMALAEANSAVAVTCSGDSTTFGQNTTGSYAPCALFAQAALARGLTGLTATNAGHSAKDTADWLASYLVTDLATNPDLYIVRWGINDPFYGLTATQTIANIRSGLATLRAAKTVDQMSIILEMPSATNDNPSGRSALFYEQLRNGFAQAARDYQAAFIDLYGAMPDNDFAVQATMMDIPYASSGTPPIHIHPGNNKTPFYNSLLVQMLLDPLAGIVGGGGSSGTFTQTLPPVSGSGIFVGSPAPGGGSVDWNNTSAATDIKHWQLWNDSTGNLNLRAVNDAGSSATTVLQIARTSWNAGFSWYLVGSGTYNTAPSIQQSGSHPYFQWHDIAGTADAFMASYTNFMIFGVNRNPSTGTFTDATKTAAAMQMNATATGTPSSIGFYTASAVNTSPVEHTRLSLGLQLGTGVIGTDPGDGQIIQSGLATSLLPTAIASAATIAPVRQINHISGTAAIASITAPAPLNANVGACIRLIADGAWTTTTAGNIFAVMTAVAGTLYEACYDGSKWFIK